MFPASLADVHGPVRQKVYACERHAAPAADAAAVAQCRADRAGAASAALRSDAPLYVWAAVLDRDDVAARHRPADAAHLRTALAHLALRHPCRHRRRGRTLLR